MIGILNPDDMTSNEILEEVSAILAKGYWRYHQQSIADKSQGVDSVAEYSLLTEKELDFPDHRSPNGDAG